MNVFVLFIEFENENKDHIVKMNIILQCLFNNEISDNLKVNFIIYTMKSFLAGKLPRFQQNNNNKILKNWRMRILSGRIFFFFASFLAGNWGLEREKLDKEEWTSLQTSLKCLY